MVQDLISKGPFKAVLVRETQLRIRQNLAILRLLVEAAICCPVWMSVTESHYRNELLDLSISF